MTTRSSHMSLYFAKRDWSLVHLMGRQLLPYKTLAPKSIQVAHIGLKDGLHENDMFGAKAMRTEDVDELKAFHGKLSGPPEKLEEFMGYLKPHDKGYGGWGHPSDHEHCESLFQSSAHRKTWKDLLHIS